MRVVSAPSPWSRWTSVASELLASRLCLFQSNSNALMPPLYATWSLWEGTPHYLTASVAELPSGCAATSYNVCEVGSWKLLFSCLQLVMSNTYFYQ